MITADNHIVHGLWIGDTLSSMEMLTIKSFVKMGHQFYLWAYDDLKLPTIEGLIIKSADDIIARKDVFSYKNKNKFGHGKGSFAGFSDIFRYKLLYEYGGWWVDMDVTCLKTLDFKEEYVFRAHHELDVVGNFMKCPKASPLMKSAYEEAVSEVNEQNNDWHKPIEILNKYIKEYHLEKYIKKNLALPDDWRIILKMIKGKSDKSIESFYFIHWLNEEWRARNLSKDLIRIESTLGALMREHGILKSDYTFLEKQLNYLRTSDLYENLRILNVVE